MGKKAKQMAALFMAGAVITGMTEMPLRVYAEEEPQKVEEKLIETDEYGNVYEIEPEIGLVEEDKSIRMARSSSAQIVNFNTKGAVVTEIHRSRNRRPGIYLRCVRCGRCLSWNQRWKSAVYAFRRDRRNRSG